MAIKKITMLENKTKKLVKKISRFQTTFQPTTEHTPKFRIHDWLLTCNEFLQDKEPVAINAIENAYNCKIIKTGLHISKKYPMIGECIKQKYLEAIHKLCRLKIGNFRPILSSFLLSKVYEVNRLWGYPPTKMTQFIDGSLFF